MNIEHLHSRIGDLAPWRCRHSALLTVSRNTGTTDRQRQQTVQPGLSGIRCTVKFIGKIRINGKSWGKKRTTYKKYHTTTLNVFAVLLMYLPEILVYLLSYRSNKQA